MEFLSTLLSIVILAGFCLLVYSRYKKQTVKETLDQLMEMLNEEKEEHV